ncbi:MAG: PilZ domain-containing protein [Sphingomonas sp.]|uniref:PilZ domain-containing protein n=1 Tax=Sphingomonas sp. TaxID=28214 RepID=UPI001AC9B01F|nr:PilZ domain-containing protein [Sphingomonas sp.]MBN8809337.1 PilZ domain-containing protein [Sphingomonas sp.]
MASRAEDTLNDRRDGPRTRSVLALGKIVHAGREHIAIVRDIASGGLKIEMIDPPEPGSYVIVEMLGLNPTPARVAWRRDRQAGLAFSMPQEVERMCRRGRDESGTAARGPRFTIAARATLRVDGRAVPIDVVNISAGGARLRGLVGVAANLPASLELRRGKGAWSGYIRWLDGADAGFSFTPPLDFRTLLDTVQSSSVPIGRS